MNCPNCGAGAHEDNLGRWFCSRQCGWNSGYTGGHGELWKVRRISRARPGRALVLHELLRLVVSRPTADLGGTVPACLGTANRRQLTR